MIYGTIVRVYRNEAFAGGLQKVGVRWYDPMGGDGRSACLRPPTP
ncbi:MAG: hypothetical protein ACUVV1_10685 [Fimbriimonadales bacterium]